MAISDTELKNVLGFYNGLRKVIVVAGFIVVTAAALGVVGGAGAFLHEKLRGLHVVFGDEAKPAPVSPPDSISAKPARPRHVRHVVTPPPVVEDQQATPVMASPVSGWEPAPSAPAHPVVVVTAPEPVPDFSVRVKPKKHRWPCRFFGAVGRGLGKVIGVR